MTDISFIYLFRKFDPVRRMIISRDTGNLNTYFSINKGQLIDLYYFCTIDKKKNDEPQTYAVKDNETGEIIYVEEKDIEKYASGRIPTEDLPMEIFT